MTSDKQILIKDFIQRENGVFEVRGVNFFPFTYGGDIKSGVLIDKDKFPILDVEKSKTHDYRLLYDEKTNSAIYEYTEKIKTEESLYDEKIKTLEQQVADLTFMIMQMQGGTN
ncbi:hypothetical protein [Metaclostridioides mangenotii]|uniref:hypothetical protein n=1 Tax=Metaclostridioides mangenotii TaxID=1540 RepID=UPI00056F77C8|nr:hypothetical protein [Clostridioides mangenotii]